MGYGFGSFYNDVSHTVAVDSLGNYYLCGSFSETVDFDPSETGVYELTSFGLHDIFIVKFDPDGAFLNVWQIGGPGSDGVVILPMGGGGDLQSFINIDGGGNIYLACVVAGECDVDPGSGVELVGASNLYVGDPVILKLDPNGDLIWHVVYEDNLGIEAACLDNEGNLYLSGRYNDTLDFNASLTESYVLNLNPPTEIRSQYILKLNTDGDFVWAGSLPPSLGSTPTCQPVTRHERVAIAVSPNNDIVVAGYFRGSQQFHMPSDTFNLTATGCADIFVLKLRPDGEPVWVNHLVGQDSIAHGCTSDIAVDFLGNIYLVGVMFNGAIDFDSDNTDFLLDRTGGYLLKLGAEGNFRWLLDHGPFSSPMYKAVTLDANHDPWVTGYFGINLVTHVGNDSIVLESSGRATMIIKADSSGIYEWASGFSNGLSGAEITYYTYCDIKADLEGGIVVSGSFRDTIDVGLGPIQYNLPSNDFMNAYILKIENPLVVDAIKEHGSRNHPVVYPNPSNGNLNLDLHIPVGDLAELEVWSISGQQVYRSVLSNGQNAINMNAAEGLYLYAVRVNGIMKWSGKLAVIPDAP